MAKQHVLFLKIDNALLVQFIGLDFGAYEILIIRAVVYRASSDRQLQSTLTLGFIKLEVNLYTLNS